MKRIASFALLVLTGISLATEIGPKVGDLVGAYDAWHVTGPDKGTETCPVCKYFNRPMVQVFVGKDSDENVIALSQVLNRAMLKHSKAPNDFRAFLLWPAKGAQAKALRVKLTDLGDRSKAPLVALMHLDSKADAFKSYKFPVNGNQKNMVLVYVKRRVVQKFIDFKATPENIQKLERAIDQVAAQK